MEGTITAAADAISRGAELAVTNPLGLLVMVLFLGNVVQFWRGLRMGKALSRMTEMLFSLRRAGHEFECDEDTTRIMRKHDPRRSRR